MEFTSLISKSNDWRTSFLNLVIVICCLVGLSCSDQSNPTYSTPETGTVWEERPGGITENLNDIIWNGQFFVVAGGTSIYTSEDARTWQLRYANAPGELRGVCWSGKQYIAVGVHSILVSDDAKFWRLISFGGILNSVAASDTLAIAVGDSGLVMLSHDLVTWQRMYYTDRALNAIIWDADYIYRNGTQPDFTGAFVLCGDEVVALCRWLDEAASFISFGTSLTWNGLTAADSVVILASACGPGYLHSANLITAIRCLGGCNAVTRFDDRFVAVSGRGTTYTLYLDTSYPELAEFMGFRFIAPVSADLNAIITVGNGCIAVGDHGTVLASPPNRH